MIEIISLPKSTTNAFHISFKNCIKKLYLYSSYSILTYQVNTQMSNHLNNISIIRSSAGEQLSIAGGSYRIIIPGKETDGQYAVS